MPGFTKAAVAGNDFMNYLQNHKAPNKHPQCNNNNKKSNSETIFHFLGNLCNIQALQFNWVGKLLQ